MARNTLSRSLHDVGLSAWFGGTLANAVALNPAAAQAEGSHAKTALTAAALGATAYSRVLGKKVSAKTDVPAESGTSPSATTPKAVADAQRQLKVLQWAVPALTGALVVISSFAGEQQRAEEVSKGLLGRFTG